MLLLLLLLFAVTLEIGGIHFNNLCIFLLLLLLLLIRSSVISIGRLLHTMTGWNLNITKLLSKIHGGGVDDGPGGFHGGFELFLLLFLVQMILIRLLILIMGCLPIFINGRHLPRR